MSLRYCVIEDETYDLAHQMDDAEQHLALAGLDSTEVWTVPYDTVEAAEDAGWDGAYFTGTRVFPAEVRS